MFQLKPKSLVKKIAWLLYFLAFVVFMLILMSPTKPVPNDVIVISDVQLVGADGHFEQVALPHRGMRSKVLKKESEYYITFNLDEEPISPLYIYIPTFLPKIEVSMAGMFLYDSQSYYTWMGPLVRNTSLILMPSSHLSKGENQFKLKVLGESLLPTVLSKVYIGTQDSVSPAYKKQLFYDDKLVLVAYAIQLILGLTLLIVALLWPKDRVFAWLGGALLSHVLFGAGLLFDFFPSIVDYYPYVFVLAAISGTSMVMFAFHLVEQKAPRGLMHAGIFVTLAVCVILVTDLATPEATASYITVPLFYVGMLAGLIVLAWGAFFKNVSDAWLMLPPFLVMVVFTGHDINLTFGPIDDSNRLAQTIRPVLFLVIFYVLMRRFSHSLKSESESEKVQFEAQLTNKNREKFFAHINHEMRTPLNGILGIVGLINKGEELKISSRQFKTLKIASQQLSNLVSNVLDHSKLSNEATFNIQSSNCNIGDMVNELEGMFLDIAHDKNLSLIFHVQDDLILPRRGDCGKLQQILINLLGNAIKFTNSGHIEVVIVEGASTDDLIFSVSDTGDGIEEDQLEDIFTAYHQVSRTGAIQQIGSGLGLYISKALSEVLGGTLSVRSELGKGTQFELRLPLPRIMSPLTQEGLLDVLELSGKTMLFVDNSMNNYAELKTFLSITGINLIAVKCGQKAVERFDKGGIDIVLMDLHMNGMDGVEVTHKIRALEISKKVEHCAIIIHTADTRSDVLEQARQAGANHCLCKPYSQTQLLKVISGIFDFDLDDENLKVPKNANTNALANRFSVQSASFISNSRAYIEMGAFDTLDEEIHQMLGVCGLFRVDSMQATLDEMKALLGEPNKDPAAFLALLDTAEAQSHVYRGSAKPY